MNGKNIIICILDETSKTPIAATKSNEWKTYVEDIEVSSPTQGDWVDRIAGRKDWSVTTSYLVTAVSDVKKCLNVGAKYRLCFCENTAGFPIILHGQAMLKECNGRATMANLLQGSFQFVGCGPLAPFVDVESISLSLTSLMLIQGDSDTIVPTIYPSNATDKRIQWSSSDTSVATVDHDGKVTAVGNGSCTITCAATDGSGVTATCNFKTADLVDLGLPSGTLWATCNIGANSPEQFGDHFAWAETEPKENYSWETYKYCEGTYNTLTKYCTDAQYGTVDDLVSLNAIDDAARKISNQKLWTPTTVRITELINSNYTTIEHTTLNGIAGVRITSKSNGNSIFLPLAPYIDGETLGIYSRYMSRNNNPTTSYYSVALQISEDNVEIITDTMRCFGFSVRPIYTPE